MDRRKEHTEIQLLIGSSCQCAFRGIFPLESAHHGYYKWPGGVRGEGLSLTHWLSDENLNFCIHFPLQSYRIAAERSVFHFFTNTQAELDTIEYVTFRYGILKGGVNICASSPRTLT